MPKLEICIYCKRSIDEEHQTFVEVPPAAQEPNNFGEPMLTQYAHANCHDQSVPDEVEPSRAR
jgi:hypothetical protein